MTDSLFTDTPSLVNENDGSAINTGTTFRVTANVTCTHHRFYAPTTGVGTVTARLYQYVDEENTPTLLAEKAYSAVTDGAYNSVAWDTPISLVTGAYYLTQHHASGGHYVATGGVFSGGDVTSVGGLLVAIQTGSSTAVGVLRNGKFKYLGLAFADQNGGGTNFFDDVIVSSGQAAAVGTATETDTAIALGRTKARTVGVAAEADGAVALAGAKARTLSLATSTEVALPVVAVKSRMLGVASETDVAVALGRAKRRLIGIASTTEVAMPIGGSAPVVAAAYRVGAPELKWSAGAAGLAWAVGPVEV